MSDAPEFFCNDIDRLELVAPGIVRVVMYADGRVPGDRIERVSVLFPLASIPGALARMAAFVAGQGACVSGGLNAVLM